MRLFYKYFSHASVKIKKFSTLRRKKISNVLNSCLIVHICHKNSLHLLGLNFGRCMIELVFIKLEKEIATQNSINSQTWQRNYTGQVPDLILMRKKVGKLQFHSNLLHKDIIHGFMVLRLLYHHSFHPLSNENVLNKKNSSRQ